MCNPWLGAEFLISTELILMGHFCAVAIVYLHTVSCPSLELMLSLQATVVGPARTFLVEILSKGLLLKKRKRVRTQWTIGERRVEPLRLKRGWTAVRTYLAGLRAASEHKPLAVGELMVNRLRHTEPPQGSSLPTPTDPTDLFGSMIQSSEWERGFAHVRRKRSRSVPDSRCHDETQRIVNSGKSLCETEGPE